MADEDIIDLRCASEDYQLDVDTLMIEYAVYNAVISHLDLLGELINFNTTTNELKQIKELINDCQQLATTFDCESHSCNLLTRAHISKIYVHCSFFVMLKKRMTGLKRPISTPPLCVSWSDWCNG